MKLANTIRFALLVVGFWGLTPCLADEAFSEGEGEDPVGRNIGNRNNLLNQVERQNKSHLPEDLGTTATGSDGEGSGGSDLEDVDGHGSGTRQQNNPEAAGDNGDPPVRRKEPPAVAQQERHTTRRGASGIEDPGSATGQSASGTSENSTSRPGFNLEVGELPHFDLPRGELFRVLSQENSKDIILRFESLGTLEMSRDAIILVSSIPLHHLFGYLRTTEVNVERAIAVFRKVPTTQRNGHNITDLTLVTYTEALERLSFKLKSLSYVLETEGEGRAPSFYGLFQGLADQRLEQFYTAKAYKNLTLAEIKNNDQQAQDARTRVKVKPFPTTYQELFETVHSQHRKMITRPRSQAAYNSDLPPHPSACFAYQQLELRDIVTPAHGTDLLSESLCKPNCEEEEAFKNLPPAEKYACGFSQQELQRARLAWATRTDLSAGYKAYFNSRDTNHYLQWYGDSNHPSMYVKIPDADGKTDDIPADASRRKPAVNLRRFIRREAAGVPEDELAQEPVLHRQRRQTLGDAIAIGVASAAFGLASLSLAETEILKKELANTKRTQDTIVDQVVTFGERVNNLTTRTDAMLDWMNVLESAVDEENRELYLESTKSVLSAQIEELRGAIDDLYGGIAALTRGEFSPLLVTSKDLKEIWKKVQQLARAKELMPTSEDPNMLFSLDAKVFEHEGQPKIALAVPLQSSHRHLNLIRASSTVFSVSNVTIELGQETILASTPNFEITRTFTDATLKNCHKTGSTYRCEGSVFNKAASGQDTCLARLVQGLYSDLSHYCELLIVEPKERVQQISNTQFLVIAPEPVNVRITCNNMVAPGSPAHIHGQQLLELQPGCTADTAKHHFVASWEVIDQVRFFTPKNRLKPAQLLPEHVMPKSLQESQRILMELRKESPLQPINLDQFKARVESNRRKLWYDLFNYRIELGILAIAGVVVFLLPIIIYRQRLQRKKRRDRRNAFSNMRTDWSRYEPLMRSVMIRAQPRQRRRASPDIELVSSNTMAPAANGRQYLTVGE